MRRNDRQIGNVSFVNGEGIAFNDRSVYGILCSNFKIIGNYSPTSKNDVIANERSPASEAISG